MDQLEKINEALKQLKSIKETQEDGMFDIIKKLEDKVKNLTFTRDPYLIKGAICECVHSHKRI